MIPLRAGNSPTFAREPRFKQDRKGEVDIVAAQQDMFTDSDPRDVGNATRSASTQLEQAEVRSAAADIDDQDVARPGIVQFLPQRSSQAVLFEPAIERCLWLFEQPHRTWEPSFLCRGQCQPLRCGVERGGNRDGDFLIVESVAITGESTVPGTPKIVQDESGSLNR